MNKVLNTHYSDSELAILHTFLEKFIIRILKPLKPDHIQYFAKLNKIADPRPIVNTLPENIKIQVRNILNDNPTLLRTYMNYDFIMNLFYKYRKDLISVLGLPENKVWFTKYIRIMRKIIEQV